jgi:uncharacterized membrane protein
MGPTPTTTPTTTNDTRKVWVFEIREVISNDFEVIAKTKAEALRLLKEHQHDYTDDAYDFYHKNPEYKVHRVDGSHQWHKDMAPQLTDKYEQKLVTKESRYINEQAYKVWERVE